MSPTEVRPDLVNVETAPARSEALSVYINILYLVVGVGLCFSVYNFLSPYFFNSVFTARRAWLKTHNKGDGCHRYETGFDPGRRLLLSMLGGLMVNLLLLGYAGLLASGTPGFSFIKTVNCDHCSTCKDAMLAVDNMWASFVGIWSTLGLITSLFLGFLSISCIYEVSYYQKLCCRRQQIVRTAQQSFVERIGYSPRSATDIVRRVQDASEVELQRMHERHEWNERVESHSARTVHISDAWNVSTESESRSSWVANGVPVCYAY